MKKFICFILILSFIIPIFLNVFPFVTYCAPSVSSDNLEKLRNADRDILGQKGYAINDDWWGFGFIDWIYDSLELTGTDHAQAVENYMINNNIDPEELAQTLGDSLADYAESQTGYYIYHAMPVSIFFRFFTFHHQDDDSIRFLQNWLPSQVNGFNTLCAFTSNYYLVAHNNAIYSLSQNLIDNNSLVLTSGQFYNYPYYDFQVCRTTSNSELGGYDTPMGGLSLYNNTTYLSYDGRIPYVDIQQGNTFENPSYLNNTTNFVNVGFLQDQFYGSWRNFAQGTLYLVPDSWGDYTFFVFKNLNAYSAFFQGDAFAYYFDNEFSNIDDLDYSKIYDVINSNISILDGNISSALNDIVNNYLSEEVAILGDIKDSLRDPDSRYSWLRLIYQHLLETNPILMTKLDEISSKLTNSSGGPSIGGSVDLESTNEILSDIYDRLGLLIGPYDDGVISEPTFQTMVSEVSTRMPFSILTDIVVLVTLFSRSPVRPDFQIPIPFNPGETFTVDLSSFEYARPFINGFFILIFIIGLLAMTTKIFDSLKG